MGTAHRSNAKLQAKGSLASGAGSLQPDYLRLQPLCNAECPAGHDIRSWLASAASGNYRQAWETMMANNPLPAVMGRVCYHACEGACNRSKFDQAVNIHAIERFVGDLAIREGWRITPGPASGKRVLVVGAGPAGLSAAYQLARLGHAVTIAEAGPSVGGMMRFGIPSYRLPRVVLDAELARIAATGVAIQTNAPVSDVPAAMAKGGFDACFLSIGAQVSKRATIATSVADKVLATEAAPPRFGERVAVYGGGNTAIDVARSALRLGAKDVRIIYRRTRARMPAHDFEIEEALEEGVILHELSTIQSFDAGALVIEAMTLDGRGWPQPTGRTRSLGIDTVIMALGQDVDISLVNGLTGTHVSGERTVVVGEDFQTGHPGVFAGGDMVPGERTVTVAVGHGRIAARAIDAWLRGEAYQPETSGETASFDRLHLWYYDRIPATEQPVRPAAERRTSFEEITGGLDEDAARVEAARCLSCGNCLECDNCVVLCPYKAVTKRGAGEGFVIDRTACKVCGRCVVECPSGALQMTADTYAEKKCAIR
jgi:NADPH-dependent glutamate synthase beta subunit-like oxidoreductase